MDALVGYFMATIAIITRCNGVTNQEITQIAIVV